MDILLIMYDYYDYFSIEDVEKIRSGASVLIVSEMISAEAEDIADFEQV